MAFFNSLKSISFLKIGYIKAGNSLYVSLYLKSIAYIAVDNLNESENTNKVFSLE
ncbi:hypothetical protein GA0061075_11110 [Weissella hellenica]|uniref:Uncharacterized protein n=1 Tax=Weissella hellenica TaxID=46256 RepID=A0ABY0K200_WEIHE|nr:hypothetical protein WHE01_12100 [Weissella hellenica]SCC02000.1 hypothetical protein GA0061075_11110 [Weissella hellenica]